MATDYQALLNTARPTTAGANNASGFDQLMIGLLVQIANTVAPAMATDFQSLLRLAETPGYLSASNSSMCQLIELALLNIIAQNIGSGGGGGGGFAGVGSPEGVQTASPGASYLQTDTNSFWMKKTGTGNTGWIELIA